MLSMFESTLLDRHLRRCPECRDFAAAAAVQTALLRSVELEAPERRVVVPVRPRSRRRGALVALASTAAAAAAAFVALAPGLQHPAAVQSTESSLEEPALISYPAHPLPGSSVEVPRLRVEPASIADGPIRGEYFRHPA